MKKNNTETGGKKKGWKFYIPMILVIAIVLILSGMWYANYSSYISTDDAYIDSDKVTVSSQIMGRILNSYVDEGDTVKQGQLLLDLDSSDLIASRNQAETQMVQASASRAQAVAKLDFEKESIRVVEIESEKATDDFSRAEKQYNGQVITAEQFDHIRKSLESAEARLKAARSQLKVAATVINSADAAIESAAARIDLLNSQLEKTRIRASTDGIVAKRWMLPGEVAQPGQAILTISQDRGLWVMVYLEETKMKNVHLGQQVNFNVDAYPDVNFSGTVYYIGANTASQFSLIPAGNASGNFTKVTQRVPLKISIDSSENATGQKSIDLLAGMSAEIKILK